MLEVLLKKLIDKNISSSEFLSLKESINQTDDKVLFEVLNDLWEDLDTNTKMTPDEIRAKLSDLKIISPAQKIKFEYKKVLRIAATIMLPVLTVLSVYLYVTNTKLEVYADNNVVISVEKGQKADITLPDGSRVKLNSSSTLSYPAKFGTNNRRITFSGEGFFQIKKDPSKKFIVHTNYLNIEVLGTTFNMLAHETDNSVEMTLIEGSVKAITQHSPIREMLVSPNQKVIYNKSSGRLNLINTNVKDETAWTRGVLLFKSEPLNTVLAQIERNYDVNIHINKEDSLSFQDIFTGRFDSIDLDGVLKIIQKHYMFDYNEKGKDIYISKRNGLR